MAAVQGPQRYRFGPFELDIARNWSRGPVEAGIRRAHWRALFAADFFTTDAWTVRAW